DVVDIAALAGNEALVFLAHHAGADAFHTHVGPPSRSFTWPLLPSKRGRLIRVERSACRSLFRGLRDLHPRRRIQHRLDDVVVAGAAADIAFEFMAHGGLVELAAVTMHHVD